MARTGMRIPWFFSFFLWALWGVTLTSLGSLVLTGCGRYSSSGVPAITMELNMPPAREDREVRKVAIDPRFQVAEYRVLVVSDFSIYGLEMNRILSPGEAQAYLKAKLMEKMADTDAFEEVADTEEAVLSATDKVLLLEGVISELEPGSRSFRSAGPQRPRTTVSVVAKLRDPKAGRVFATIRQKRETTLGVWGRDGRQFLLESLERIAQDMADAIKALRY